MKRRRVDHKPGVEHEPHLAGKPFELHEPGDLEDEPARASEVDVSEAEYTTDWSVSDEPSLGWRRLDRAQWPGFAEHLRDRLANTPAHYKWLAVIAAALFAGPFAVLGAFLKALTGEGGWGYMAIVVIGPVLEEILKVALVLWLVERMPWLIPGARPPRYLPGAVVIVMIGAIGGLSFAAIENGLYLNVYFPDHGPDLVRWRWTLGVALHVGCSVLAAWGIAKMWREVMMTGRPADLARAFPWLATAIVIHGAYNAMAVILDLAGLGP